MKMYRGSEGIAPLILNRGTWLEGEWASGQLDAPVRLPLERTQVVIECKTEWSSRGSLDVSAKRTENSVFYLNTSRTDGNVKFQYLPHREQPCI